MMRPMHQTTELVPLVHAAKFDSIAQADRHALRQVNVVRNQQRLSIRQGQDESLMSRPLVVVGQ